MLFLVKLNLSLHLKLFLDKNNLGENCKTFGWMIYGCGYGSAKGERVDASLSLRVNCGMEAIRGIFWSLLLNFGTMKNGFTNSQVILK